MFSKTIKHYPQINYAYETDSEIAETLNDFFSNTVKNFNISRYFENDSVAENITEATLRAILKYKDHPSILAIQSQCEAKKIRFTEVNTEDIKKEICDALRDLVLFVQLKKSEKHPCPATLLKLTLLHGYFSCLLNCTNGTKSRKASYIQTK